MAHTLFDCRCLLGSSPSACWHLHLFSSKWCNLPRLYRCFRYCKSVHPTRWHCRGIAPGCDSFLSFPGRSFQWLIWVLPSRLSLASHVWLWHSFWSMPWFARWQGNVSHAHVWIYSWLHEAQCCFVLLFVFLAVFFSYNNFKVCYEQTIPPMAQGSCSIPEYSSEYHCPMLPSNAYGYLICWDRKHGILCCCRCALLIQWFDEPWCFGLWHEKVQVHPSRPPRISISPIGVTQLASNIRTDHSVLLPRQFSFTFSHTSTNTVLFSASGPSSQQTLSHVFIPPLDIGNQTISVTPPSLNPATLLFVPFLSFLSISHWFQDPSQMLLISMTSIPQFQIPSLLMTWRLPWVPGKGGNKGRFLELPPV